MVGGCQSGPAAEKEPRSLSWHSPEVVVLVRPLGQGLDSPTGTWGLLPQHLGRTGGPAGCRLPVDGDVALGGGGGAGIQLAEGAVAAFCRDRVGWGGGGKAWR